MYDAVVVLGAGANDMSIGRIKKGIEVVKKGLARVFIFVGGADDGEIAKQLGIAYGLSNSQIYIDTNSRNTVDNAYYAKKILKKLRIRKVALVTSRFHMERALAIFEWVLGNEFSVEPIPVDDTPSKDDLEEELYLTKIFVPIMKKLFAKGDAENIKKAVDALYTVLHSLFTG